jgi:hypothetical protein
MSRGLRDLEARGQRPAARSPPLVEGDPRGPETFSAEPALEGLLLTHSRPCACGPRLGPQGGTESPESVRQRSNLVMLLTDAQCQERKSTIRVCVLLQNTDCDKRLLQARRQSTGSVHHQARRGGFAHRCLSGMATKTSPRRNFNTLTVSVEATATKCGVVVVAVASLPQAVRRRHDRRRRDWERPAGMNIIRASLL